MGRYTSVIMMPVPDLTATDHAVVPRRTLLYATDLAVGGGSGSNGMW